MTNLLKEPLLHFLGLGAVLFLAYGALNPDLAEDPSLIVVNRDRLLTHLQYRSRAFDAQRSQAALDRLSVRELEGIIDDYVREEALYREARALGLDRNDYVARLRLIQQLEFVARGFVEADTKVPEAAVRRYYEEHRQEYYRQPQATFTHVFFSDEVHGPERARVLADETLDELNSSGTPFEGAVGRGDAFLYFQNYIEREPDLVAAHFGPELTHAIFSLPAGEEWRGPYRSPYGYHLVLLTRREEGYTPPLEEMRDRVEQDARDAAQEARLQAALEAIVRTYNVQVAADVRRRKGA